MPSKPIIYKCGKRLNPAKPGELADKEKNTEVVKDGTKKQKRKAVDTFRPE